MTSTNPEIPRPLLLGHRGARKYAPENTLEAFELALEHGCQGFEFDVRCTADRRLLIWHDATVKRARIAHAEYESLCQRAQKGWRRKKSRTGEGRIPCLEEVVGAFRDRAYLNIEVKVAGIEKEVAGLASTLRRDWYLVSSFQPDVVLNLRAANPELAVGWIVNERRLLADWRQIESHALVAHHTLVSRGLVEAVQASGRKLFVWTVNRPKKMLELADWGVDAIISDDTRLLAGTLGSSKRNI
ncbi:MAG: glycerophosphodiester phosphodiesterase [Acidobacteriales bacterium]|nr:glycerophosphodiester phosphodiesterase [Terriglobales bacterium]